VLEDRKAVAIREQVCHGDKWMSDLVLLHGIGTGPEAWAPQVDAFSSTRRVLTPRVPLDLGRAVEELQAVDAARFDLCGLSWGALVALRFALEEPARVRRLAVCAGFASLPRALRALQYALSLAGRELARPMREGARFDVRSQITLLESPLLVLYGERDRVNRPLSRALAIRVPQANFELIPDAGHVANVDNPAAFTAALEHFFG